MDNEATGSVLPRHQGTESTESPPIALTPTAVEMVKQAMREEGFDAHGLRVAVRGGGCSGLEYVLDYDENTRPGDTVFVVDGLRVFIDMASANFLGGTLIDYVKGINGVGFKFNNPNATRTCGCGSSFS